MSLNGFIKMAEVAAKIKPFRPKIPRRIPAELKVKPGTNRFSMVGTAFDYLLRFELQRQAPHAVCRELVAENVPSKIWESNEGGRVRSFLPLSKDNQGLVSFATGRGAGVGSEELAKETAERTRRVVETAKSAVAAYVLNGSPGAPERAEVAKHAIQLAKLDSMYRASQFDSTFEEAAPEDVDDLLAMLAIVPFESLMHHEILLNPIFGDTSKLVGGADTDLISGDMLVDLKTTKKSAMHPRELDQLFGYFLLARHQRHDDPNFPEIKRVALYFCRHGHLWTLNSNIWTDLPEFSDVEQWFFQRAGEVFSKARIKWRMT